METHKAKGIRENGHNSNNRFNSKELLKKCPVNIVYDEDTAEKLKAREDAIYRRREPLHKILVNTMNKSVNEFCPNISKYEKLAKIGQGTFGEVFKARDRKTQQFVAMKKVLISNEETGFPITAIREIKILQLLKYEHIVNLIDVCHSDDTNVFSHWVRPTFYLIFDFCEHDLAGLLSNASVRFSLAEVKMVMRQLLNGLFFMHCHKIIHRDIKAANILITKEGVLKIADFGLSRNFSLEHPNRLTPIVVTLYYRPPEILLGDRNYGTPVDMWGSGCLMPELWTKEPILRGSNEAHQIRLITELCGSITPESLPNVDKLDLYSKVILPSGYRRKVKERLRDYVEDEDALDLIDLLLRLDPSKRIDANNALDHSFFFNDPQPCKLDKLLAGISKSQFEYSNRTQNNGQTVVAPFQPKKNDDQYHDLVY